jgi:hypothetical protein
VAAANDVHSKTVKPKGPATFPSREARKAVDAVTCSHTVGDSERTLVPRAATGEPASPWLNALAHTPASFSMVLVSTWRYLSRGKV